MRILLLLAALAAVPAAAQTGGADLRRADRRAQHDCRTIAGGGSTGIQLFDLAYSTYAYTDRKFVMLSAILGATTDYVRVSTYSNTNTGFPVYPLGGPVKLEIGRAIPLFVTVPGSIAREVCGLQAE